MTLYMTGKKRVETGMKIFSIRNSFTLTYQVVPLCAT